MPPTHGRFNVVIFSLLPSLYLADEEMTWLPAILKSLVVIGGRGRFVDNFLNNEAASQVVSERVVRRKCGSLYGGFSFILVSVF